MNASADGWAPEVYARFASARSAPFDDLLKLVSPARGGTLLDLGCGTGALTSKAHHVLQVARSLGIDSSSAMLKTAELAPGVTLEQYDCATTLPDAKFDRVISNSAFNWFPDHRAYLPKVLSLVAPGGELAVQMPSNNDTPFVRCAMEAAEQLTSELKGFVWLPPVEPPEVYAELLARDAQVAESKVGAWYYPQLHQSVSGLVEFAQGGLLSAYRARLSPADFERFCAAYREALERAFGKGAVFFPFRRVFVFARIKGSA
jgi:trans-aconitate 2-methyltransferase